jgi:hypothetical protein
MKLRSVVYSLFTYLLQLKHDDRNCSFCSSMRIRTGYNVDQIIFAVISHEDKAIRSRPKAVLQLIEHDGHTPSAADLQLIRAEHLPNGTVNVVAHIGLTTGAINVERAG